RAVRTPAVGFGHALDPGQPHAAPPPGLRIAAAHAVELVEDLPSFLARHADAAVGDGDDDATIRCVRLDPEPPAVAGELDRVVHEVRQGLPDGVGVHGDLRKIGTDLHLDLEALLGGRIRERI